MQKGIPSKGNDGDPGGRAVMKMLRANKRTAAYGTVGGKGIVYYVERTGTFSVFPLAATTAVA